MVIAIIQDSPVYNNKKLTLDKTLQLISESKKGGAELIVFGESWFSGYPVWLDICPDVALWNHDPVKSVWSDMYDGAINIEENDLEQIKKVASDMNVWIVIGANEIISKGSGNGTIYNSVFTISNNGETVNHHRKLMPTFTEKLVYGQGDGAGLHSVKTSFGYLGALICWEHWMPLTRQTMHDEAEDIHIALWPYVKEMHQICARQYAFEGRCHVVSVGQIMEAKEIPHQLVTPDHLRPSDYILKGGSSIYGPDGTIILEPLYNKRSVIYQELNLSINNKEKMNLSVSGHYNRPDIFDLRVNKKRAF